MGLAIEMDGYGPPDVLHPVQRRDHEPAQGEVVVRVAAAGVNRADCFIRSGEWTQAGGWPYVPGLEACGTVARVGASVTEWRPGDRVITMMQRLGGIHGERAGGYQEEVCVLARTLARVPDGLELRDAAALGLAAVTAWCGLRALDVRDGQRVLVLGGSSGVGTMVLQLLRRAGAHAIATGTRVEKFDLMRRCGAAEVISTREPQWSAQIGRVDRVFDLLGKDTFAAATDALAPEGRLVFVGGTTGGELSFSGWNLMRPITITGWSSETLDRDRLQQAIDAVAAARLVAAEVHTYPLTEAARAHAELESGRSAGRVLLVP
jgi:NADPH2:quinone reductase